MPSFRRAVLSAAALVLLAAQATGVLHLLIAPHETCPIDGELVERAPAPTDTVRTRRADSSHHRVDGGASAHEHDRCLATPGDIDALPSSSATPAPIALEQRPLRPVLRAWAAPTGPPLYRIAPKTSPPA